jgi:hypothetical protein
MRTSGENDDDRERMKDHCFTILVPKLCLGTQAAKLRFASGRRPHAPPCGW